MFYIITVINILYIAAELVFNSILLNTASTQIRLEDIHSVEILGRSLAAFGFTFILYKFFESKFKLTLHKLILMVVISLTAYPLFYLAQEFAVNSIADNSSLETRKKMNDIFLLKQGLINGSLQLNTVPYNEEIKDLPESKTFITNIPLFLMSNDKVLEFTNKNKDKIATLVFENEVLNSPMKYVSIYTSAILKLNMQYKQYSSANTSRLMKLKNVDNLVNNQYEDLIKYLTWRFNKENDTQKYIGMSFNNYIKTEEIQNVIRKKIKEKTGKSVSGFIDVSSSSALKGSLKVSINEGFTNMLNVVEKETGFKIPAGLNSRVEFINNKEVQKILKSKLGSLYVEMNLNEHSFNDNDVNADLELIKKNAKKIGEKMAHDFLNSDLSTAKGASIVKAMIVPPIALFLSLFFALINTAILLSGLINRYTKFNKDNSKSFYSNLIVLFAFIGLASLTIFVDNEYTQSESYVKVLKNLEDSNIVLAKSVDWIMKAEPLFYKYGDALMIKKTSL